MPPEPIGVGVGMDIAQYIELQCSMSAQKWERFFPPTDPRHDASVVFWRSHVTHCMSTVVNRALWADLQVSAQRDNRRRITGKLADCKDRAQLAAWGKQLSGWIEDMKGFLSAVSQQEQDQVKPGKYGHVAKYIYLDLREMLEEHIALRDQVWAKAREMEV